MPLPIEDEADLTAFSSNQKVYMSQMCVHNQGRSYELSYPSYSVLLVLRAGENGRTP